MAAFSRADCKYGMMVVGVMAEIPPDPTALVVSVITSKSLVTNAKNPVPMKPTDAKTKLEKPAAKAAPAKAKDAAAKAGSAGTAAPAEKAAAPAAKAGAAAAPAGKLAEPKKDKPKSPAPAPQ